MARRGKGYQGLKRKLSDIEKANQFESDLDTLQSLCNDYDNGRIEYSFLIATQIQKVLTEGRVSTERRGQTLFPSPNFDDDPTNLMSYSRLVAMQIEGGQPPTGSFVSSADLKDVHEWKRMKFSKWWAEVIYRASAAPPGTPPGLIPVNEAPSVPFEKRERLSRRLLVQTLRDYRGAHRLEDFPKLLEEIDGPDSWGGCNVNDRETGETFSTSDGSLSWRAGQLAAMVRHVATEVLSAFGRLPAPTTHSDDTHTFL